MDKVKGLLVSVYKDGGVDCTMGGITSKKDNLILVGDTEDLKRCPFSPEDGEDYLVYVKDYPFADRSKPREYAVPKSFLDEGKDKGTYMFGGNFIYCSDSRFPSRQPLPVFDRFETWEEYEMYSR